MLLLEARVTALEERFTHLERLVDQLNLVLTEQQATLERLARHIDHLREAAASNGGAGGEAGTSEEPPPPHY